MFAKIRVSMLAALLAMGCGGGSDPAPPDTAGGDPGTQPNPPPSDPGAPPVPAPNPAPSPAPPLAPSSPVSVALAQPYGTLAFTQPVSMVQAPGDPSHWYVVEQRGTVQVFDVNEAQPTSRLVIDIRDRVVSGGELGLLGLAFHPEYLQNGRAFLSYTARGATVRYQSHIAEFRRASADPLALDAASERAIMVVDQVAENHNGGHLAFGLDGMLYVGFGDGGGRGDPRGNAQNTNSLLGKLLRIDVNGAEPYAIPPDNPFVAGGGRPEVYALGFRNPWRFSFDRATGAIWLADVGQATREEIDYITPGGNYGWNIREGTTCFQASGCDTTGLIEPLVDYGRDVGATVIGGYVYRGAAIAALTGTYLYADFIRGIVWGLNLDQGRYVSRTLASAEMRFSAFGEDQAGELYLLDYLGGGILRIVPAGS